MPAAASTAMPFLCLMVQDLEGGEIGFEHGLRGFVLIRQPGEHLGGGEYQGRGYVDGVVPERARTESELNLENPGVGLCYGWQDALCADVERERGNLHDL